MDLTLSDFEKRKLLWHREVASCRLARWSSSAAYQRVRWRMLATIVPPDCRVLHVGCGDGSVLSILAASRAVGIEASAELAAIARQRHPGIEVRQGSLENFATEEKFDFILVDNVLLDCFDVDELLESTAKACHAGTRVLLTNYSQLWRPILELLRFFRLARPRFGNSWLSPEDLRSGLSRRGFEIISSRSEVLLPLEIPWLTAFMNRFLARLPLFRNLCLHHILIARRKIRPTPSVPSVSVIVPARNEAGNISRLMREIPSMGAWTEVIFVEGNSTDETWATLEKAVREKNDPLFRLIQQPGQGKGDAVRAGFSLAKGDILMILDADLTTPAETLPRFYDVVARGHADFANGTRLVYGMDERAMQLLNLLANHFFAQAFTFVLGQPIRDTLCGTKAFSKKLYEKIALNRAYFGDFDPFGDFDLLLGAARLHAKIDNIPIRYRERTYGKTNISRFQHGFLLIKMLRIAATKLKFN